MNDYLTFKKDGEGNKPVLVGGRSEALIIHATRVQKISEGTLSFLLALSLIINYYSTFSVLSIWRSVSPNFPNFYKPS